MIGPALAIYGLCALMTAVMGGLMLASAYFDERRQGARIILGSPLWPALWIYGLWLAVRHIIEEADL